MDHGNCPYEMMFFYTSCDCLLLFLKGKCSKIPANTQQDSRKRFLAIKPLKYHTSKTDSLCVLK